MSSACDNVDDDGDVEMRRVYESSSEEHTAAAAAAAASTTVLRKRKRNTNADAPPPSVSAATTALAPPPVASYAAESAVRAALAQPTPRIESMTQLLHDFPHVRTDSDCRLVQAKLTRSQGPPAMSASAARASPEATALECDIGGGGGSSKEEVVRLHLEASQTAPEALLRRERDALVRVDYSVAGSLAPMTDAYVRQLLASQRVSLPLFTASHEQTQLQQSGTFRIGGRLLTFPPCCHGLRCVGQDTRRGVQHLTEPVVFMRAMTPPQWSHFVATGEAPATPGPCILCHRVRLASYVHHCRFLTAESNNNNDDETKKKSEGEKEEEEEGDELYQLWRNPVDCADGYRSEYILPIRPGDAVVAPLVEPFFYTLEARKLGVIWTVQQTRALLWEPPAWPSARVGETLSVF